MAQMLDVNLDGFKELQAGRPKWSFIREMISNSLDEKAKNCTVDIRRSENDHIITIIDDGPGFRNLADAYTLYGSTPKRQDPTVRGRFNLGEKEFAAIAKSLRITTTTGTIEFTEDRERIHDDTRKYNGTEIEARVDWTDDEIEEVVGMVKIFQPPQDSAIWINTESFDKPAKIERSELIGKTNEYLQTVILDGFIMELTTRFTDVMVYKLKRNQTDGWLYELGIPIAEIECPYNVDVQQKVPLTPNRTSVPTQYLEHIYATVLNVVHKDLDESDVSASWVHEAFGSHWVKKSSAESVFELKYPQGAVLETDDTQANERAKHAGKQVLRKSEISADERDVFINNDILVPTTVDFGSEAKTSEEIPKKNWTESMLAFEKLTTWLGCELQDRYINLYFFNDILVSDIASITNIDDIMYVNLARFNLSPGLKMGETEVSLILHELAHNKGTQHDDVYVSELERLGGRLSMLVVHKLESFLMAVGWTTDNILDQIDLKTNLPN